MLGGALEAQHGAAAALAGREAEMQLRRPALGRRNALELLEILDAALHERRLRRLGAEAADERLEPLDLLLLRTVRGELLLALRGARLEIAAVGRRVVGQPAA